MSGFGTEIDAARARECVSVCDNEYVVDEHGYVPICEVRERCAFAAGALCDHAERATVLHERAAVKCAVSKPCGEMHCCRREVRVYQLVVADTLTDEKRRGCRFAHQSYSPAAFERQVDCVVAVC
jgi:hypothetical protein